MRHLLRIWVLAALALILMGCYNDNIRPPSDPNLPPIDMPDLPGINFEPPEAAMEECEPVRPPQVSPLPPSEQPEALVIFVGSLYGAWSDCAGRHLLLIDWVKQRTSTMGESSND